MNKLKQTYSPYADYKDSGVAWLGDVPTGWENIKFKYLFNEINTRNGDGSKDLLSVSQYTGVTKKSDNIKNEALLTNAKSLEDYKQVSKGDLVSNIMLTWNGSLGFSSYNGITSPAYCIYRLQSNNYVGQYFHYLLRTDLYKSEFKRQSSGVIDSRLRLYTDDFFNILSIVPKPFEQTAIAHFLDDKVGKIERLISIKQQQIERLKERKQILIQNAVTQGLNPNAPKKDSGIDWIGEIPAHWEVKSLNYIARLKSGDTISAEKFKPYGFPVFGGNGFRGYTNKYTNEGDFVLIGRQGALCGNVNYASGKFFASEHAIVAYPQLPIETSWLGELIRKADFNRLSQSAAQPGISIETISKVRFPYAPIKEQHEITKLITCLSKKINTAIAIKENQIEKLNEYKTTLINAAVTGKIKVPEAPLKEVVR